MKTMADLEAESTEGFGNPVLTLKQQNEVDAFATSRRAYEALHTPVCTVEDQEDEDEEDGN